MAGPRPLPPGATDYRPYDDRTQPPRSIADYPRSQRRTPREPFVGRPLTLSERTGPTALERILALGPADMSRPVAGQPQAIGQYIEIGGRVIDEDGVGVAGAVLELWQANAAGRYVHELDLNDAPRDPHFVGACRLVTDGDGRFTLRTIKPGAYPVAHSTWEWRAPHIHVSILGGSWMNRLVTQLFFPGEPLNDHDLLLNAIPSPGARQRLIVRPLPTVVKPSGNLLSFAHDFVLRGRQATPDLIDDDEQPGPYAHLTTGPFFPPQFLETACRDVAAFAGRRAAGPRIRLVGRVTDDGGAATVNTVVELWQADAGGTFRHPLDPRAAGVDGGFCGWGRGATDGDGWYAFDTVMPGRSPSDIADRAPHANVMLLASGIMRPLVTTVFFADEPDPVLDAVVDPGRRRRLIAVRDAALDVDGVPAWRFDVVLRGDGETPFFLD